MESTTFSHPFNNTVLKQAGEIKSEFYFQMLFSLCLYLISGSLVC